MTKRQTYAAGQFMRKGREEGVIVHRQSPRTKAWYPIVSIIKGPRVGQWEFPEKGWTVDNGDTGGNIRPATEPEDYVGSEDWKTKHHAK